MNKPCSIAGIDCLSNRSYCRGFCSDQNNLFRKESFQRKNSGGNMRTTKFQITHQLVSCLLLCSLVTMGFSPTATYSNTKYSNSLIDNPAQFLYLPFNGDWTKISAFVDHHFPDYRTSHDSVTYKTQLDCLTNTLHISSAAQIAVAGLQIFKAYGKQYYGGDLRCWILLP